MKPFQCGNFLRFIIKFIKFYEVNKIIKTESLEPRILSNLIDLLFLNDAENLLIF